MGNPLYLSPVYNDDGAVEVKNSRMWALHFGVGGSPLPGFRYRLLATYQKGFGTYSKPYPDPRQCASILLEGGYAFAEDAALRGWAFKAGLGVDVGSLRGDNYGLQLTVVKSGVLNFSKRKK